MKTRSRSQHQLRQLQTLVALIECYIEIGKPVGSQMLKELRFPSTSSATLRNHFAALEKEGYLRQEHASSGRTPTAKGFSFFAEKQLELFLTAPNDQNHVFSSANLTTSIHPRALSLFLQRMAHELSSQTECATFISSPKFDRDTITEIKVVPVDSSRCLSIVVTSFGFIHTLILQTDGRVSLHFAGQCERYFANRLHNRDDSIPFAKAEQSLADRIYDETMVRYFVESNLSIEEDLFRTGYYQLFKLMEHGESAQLPQILQLFEHSRALRLLLRDCMAHKKPRIWIGESLTPFFAYTECAILAMPYFIHGKTVGAVGVISSMRTPYLDHLRTLRGCVQEISHYLSDTLSTQKIGYRIPEIEKKPTLSELKLLTHSKNPK
ncbi:MAG: hypothetical protein KDK40_02305 [Chlamydiia bacterium]|nr:hypothetical protein [Chlamydiia bacterium]